MGINGKQLNILQLYRKSKDSDVANVFHSNLKRIERNIWILEPQLSATDIAELDLMLNKFYISKGQWSSDPNVDKDRLPVSTPKRYEYPTLRELILMDDFLRNKYRHEDNRSKLVHLVTLGYVLRDILDKYTTLDGHTNVSNKEAKKAFSLARMTYIHYLLLK